MATHPYPSHHYHYGSLDDSYKHYTWGVTHQTLPNYSPNLDTLQYLSNDRPNDDYPITHIEYSQASSMQQNFRKFKTNQLQVLKSLKREYEVLKNTDLDLGRSNRKNIDTQSIQSNDSVSRSGYSQARSSSNSVKQNKSRLKSQQKEMKMVILQKKQLEVIVSNSMKKIEQLLKQQIQLKKTVSQLKGKIETNNSAHAESIALGKKHYEQIELLKRTIQQQKFENQSLKQKCRTLNKKIDSYQMMEQRDKFQLRGRQQRIRALQQEVYLQKSKVTNLQLEIKKNHLQSQLIQNKFRNQIALLQKKLTQSSSNNLINEKIQEINRLKYELDVKEQRYKFLVSHRNKQKKQSSIQNKEYIKILEQLIGTLKDEKHQKANSQQNLKTLLHKLNEAQEQNISQTLLSSEISLLRKELDELRQNSSKNQETHLLEKIKNLQKLIQEENVQKFYFCQDLQKLQAQLSQEKKVKQQSLKEIKQLKTALRKMEEQAKLYSYELQTLRNRNVESVQNEQQIKKIAFKAQQMHFRQTQIVQLKQELEESFSRHRKQITQYEQELRIVKRQLAQQQIKNFRIKEELELKISLMKTQNQAQIARLHDDLQRAVKNHAIHLNEKVSQNVQLQSKVVQKKRQAEQSSQQINALLKQRDAFLNGMRMQHEQKLKHIQERHSAEIKSLAQKLQSLVILNQRHSQVVSRNAVLEQQLLDTKRCLRQNRQLSQGVDHLWRVKQAQYCNLNEILDFLNDI